MVPKVTLISNLKMNIVTKFQVFIFKNNEVRWGGETSPPNVKWVGSEATWNRVNTFFKIWVQFNVYQNSIFQHLICLKNTINMYLRLKIRIVWMDFLASMIVLHTSSWLGWLDFLLLGGVFLFYGTFWNQLYVRWKWHIYL